MKLNQFKEKLRLYKKKEIKITDHAYAQAIFRNINIDEVKENIINPEKLSFVREQKGKSKNEKKYDCYFGYSKNLCHRYILLLKNNCIVCTIIKVRRRWQKIIEKKQGIKNAKI